MGGAFGDRAYIPRKKLVLYLLSESHAVGKSKARFFKQIGYDHDNLDLLEQGLLNIFQNNEITGTTDSPHGKKYIIDGTLHAPIDKTITLRTVWIIDTGRVDPRFVTAYPLKR